MSFITRCKGEAKHVTGWFFLRERQRLWKKKTLPQKGKGEAVESLSGGSEEAFDGGALHASKGTRVERPSNPK